MEGVERSSFVIVPLKDLTPEQRALMHECDPDLYPETIDVDGMPIPASDIFQLKGHDQPTSMPKRMETRGRTLCVLGFRRHGDSSAASPATFVGSSISERADAKGQRLPKPKDMFKVAFCADSQTPHIELSTRVGGTNPGASDTDLLITRIYAQDLFTTEGTVSFALRSPKDMDEALVPGDREPGNANQAELRFLQEKGRLHELVLTLRRSAKRQIWTRMPKADVEDIFDDESIRLDTEYTITRDTAIMAFNRKPEPLVISIFITSRTAEEAHLLFDMLYYMERLMTIAANYGNF
jgi:hypothetical protein